MAKNKPAKDMMNDVENKTNLVGYVRKSNAGGAVKVSINTDAFTECETYVTSDGQEYVPLIINQSHHFYMDTKTENRIEIYPSEQ